MCFERAITAWRTYVNSTRKRRSKQDGETSAAPRTVVARLFNVVRRACVTLLQFLAALTLGVLATLLVSLPWLLRALAVLIWLAAALVGIQTIQTLYSPTSSIPLFALQFAVILLMVAWVTYTFIRKIQIWGALIAGGLVVWSLAQGILWLAAHWQSADLFFGMLPTLVFVVGVFAEAAHLRAKRKTGSQTAQPELDTTGGIPA